MYFHNLVLFHEVDQVLSKTDSFFGLSKDIKSRYRINLKGDSPYGWDELERQTVNPERPPDLKESFDIVSAALENKSLIWPDDVLPNFKHTIVEFQMTCQTLGMRVLEILAIGLNQEPDVFTRTYKLMGKPGGGTLLRFNYYPRISNNIQVKPNQIRFGEHTDYGAITLLFQDDAGGLEVGTVDGKYVPVTPIPGTILVITGDLLQRWTTDKLKAAPHRVVIPEDEIKKRNARRSIIFFCNPDFASTITCLDGSDKYPPVNCGNYLQELNKKTYNEL
ncbi:UPF0676 protein [Exaiptasia diaphana]|nr:UPF0676 protein [Exaiptasia diaphana]